MLFPREPGAFSCQTLGFAGLWLCPSGVRGVGCCLNQLLDLHLSSWNYWYGARVPNLCPIISVESVGRVLWESFFTAPDISSAEHRLRSATPIDICCKHRDKSQQTQISLFLWCKSEVAFCPTDCRSSSVSEHHPFSSLNSGFSF